MKIPFQVGNSSVNWAKARGVAVEYAPTSISTNTLARDNFVTDTAALKLYLTDEQMGGRGRNGNSWSSPPAGTSLLSSWSFQLAKAPQPIFSPLVGLAVFNAARLTWPQLPWSLKAPNDLYLGSQKIAGLLIEMQEAGLHRRVIIGLGLNIFASPPSVETATSVQPHLPAEITELTWWDFLAKLQLNFIAALAKGIVPFLTGDDRMQLGAALSLNPTLDESKVAGLISVEADGSLLTKTGLISWSDL